MCTNPIYASEGVGLLLHRKFPPCLGLALNSQIPQLICHPFVLGCIICIVSFVLGFIICICCIIRITFTVSFVFTCFYLIKKHVYSRIPQFICHPFVFGCIICIVSFVLGCSLIKQMVF